jgi:hypothetical protein
LRKREREKESARIYNNKGVAGIITQRVGDQSREMNVWIEKERERERTGEEGEKKSIAMGGQTSRRQPWLLRGFLSLSLSLFFSPSFLLLYYLRVLFRIVSIQLLPVGFQCCPLLVLL